MQYLNVFSDPKFSSVTDDEKFMVGTVFLDYLHSMMDEPYIFETHFCSLILQLQKTKQQILILLKVIELYHTDLKQLVPRLFTLLVR